MSPPGRKREPEGSPDHCGGDRDLHSRNAAALQTAVSEAVDILDTLPAFPLDGPPPRYEAGWMVIADDGGERRVEAFLRPYSEDWYSLFPCRTWWHAEAKAIEIAQATPDCEFIGGPPWGGVT